jgi:hypothetical protein
VMKRCVTQRGPALEEARRDEALATMSIARRLADKAADVLAFFLRLGGRMFYRYFVEALWQRHPSFESPASKLPVRLHYPDPVTPDVGERAMVERLFAAFRAAKQAEQSVDPIFHPGGGWRRVRDRSFAPLVEGAARGDLEPFHRFLANFGSWKEPTGIETSRLVHEASVDSRKRRHFEQRIMAPMIQWWLTCGSGGRDLSEVDLPRHGNQCGVLVGDVLVTSGAIFSEVYGRMLAGLVSGERPVIAELGGGFGRLAYYLCRHLQKPCYLGFDLPETLCCASYYLMKAFPERTFLLYGEGEPSLERLRGVDFTLLPAFEIGKLPPRCIDLFLNENSLGDMPGTTARLFVGEMCRTADAIWHRNHEAWRNEFEEGGRSLINREYPIAPEFEEVLRHCDPAGLMVKGRLDYDADMFWYYYKRRPGAPA